MSKKFQPKLSKVAKLRQPSPIRALMPLLKIPGMISLGGGLPNPELFPFEEMSFRLKDGTQLSLEGADLAEALQYSPTPGLPRLLRLLHTLQERFHGISSDDVAISVTTGSQDALWRVFEEFSDPGDAVVVESPTYSGALAFLRPRQHELLSVETDAQGLIPDDLRNVLTRRKQQGGSMPRLLYTIPTGQNPSGRSTSTERKREIYEIAREFDLLIVEDDPYYFLAYADEPPTSYLSFDVDGRVLRLDSVSKLLSSGLRLGWVTGPSALVHQIDLLSQATSLHSCGVAQAAAASLLEHWGVDGFDEHVRQVKQFYQQRCDRMMRCIDTHLRNDKGDLMVEFDRPTAGMFVWMRLLQHSDSAALINQDAVAKKVLLLPGQCFDPADHPTGYVRASFSTCSDEDMDEAMRRFGALLRGDNSSE
ncbi:MAG: hypothetical protein MHM6MM_004057 [Cercozoa sp. M6MM]